MFDARTDHSARRCLEGLKSACFAVPIPIKKWLVAPTILFVDDEAPIRELLSLFFRKKGIEVVTATTGLEALSILEDRHFDLAILDLNLAGENGLELLKQFKREYPKLPVIIFTGLTGDTTLVEQVKAAGGDGFMRKAEPLDNLYEEVKKHLPRQAPI